MVPDQDTPERREIAETQVTAHVNKTKAKAALVKHRQLLQALDQAAASIRRARHVAT